MAPAWGEAPLRFGTTSACSPTTISTCSTRAPTSVSTRSWAPTPCRVDGVEGTYFAVWAPNARACFRHRRFQRLGQAAAIRCSPRGSPGIWEGFIPGVGKGALYKYHIVSRYNGYQVDKADPFAFYAEMPPRTASVVWDLDYTWGDEAWMAKQARAQLARRPHLHLRGAPRLLAARAGRRQPLADLPGAGPPAGRVRASRWASPTSSSCRSWSTPSTAPGATRPPATSPPPAATARPQDFMYLVDYLHQHGIGVILDWVPSHFPTDEHGLGYFDGTHLYEHADPRQGFHPDWNSFIFNYGRNEVRSFLISSALFWLDKYHVDGLRVDAVASMLYLDYSRKEGEWIPNQYGGRENLEAIDFLRRFNEEVYQQLPRRPDHRRGVHRLAAWSPRPTYVGGLGFGLKWDMGWMHDTLEYMSPGPRPPQVPPQPADLPHALRLQRELRPAALPRRGGARQGLAARQDAGRRLAEVRQPAAAVRLHVRPAGQEAALHGRRVRPVARVEPRRQPGLAPAASTRRTHRDLQHWVRDLNQLYRAEPALCTSWTSTRRASSGSTADDADNSVISFLREGQVPGDAVLVVACNFTPVPRHNYRVGVPQGGFWQEMLNSDAPEYGGSGQGNLGGVEAEALPHHGRPYSLRLTLPPLSVTFFKCKDHIRE